MWRWPYWNQWIPKKSKIFPIIFLETSFVARLLQFPLGLLLNWPFSTLHWNQMSKLTARALSEEHVFLLQMWHQIMAPKLSGFVVKIFLVQCSLLGISSKWDSCHPTMCSQGSRHFTRQSFLVAVSKHRILKYFPLNMKAGGKKNRRYHHYHSLLQFYHIIIFVWLFTPAPHSVARFLDDTNPKEGVLL